MKVKAAVARSREKALRLEGLTLAEPGSDEVLVKMLACGVAQADLDAIDGRSPMPLPFVPGTEGAGIVERVGGAVSRLAPGDAVVIGFDFCGRCESCAAGRPRACVDFAALNLAAHPRSFVQGDKERNEVNGRFYGQSSFATHVVCRASRAVKLPTGAALEVLACLGGEFLRGAGAVIEAFELEPDDSLLVVGADAVGLAATMVAKARGAALVVVADSQERRRTLASELGADAAIHANEDIAGLVRSLAGNGVRFALETTGGSAARDACLASLAKGGTCAVRDAPADLEARFPRHASLIPTLDGHAAPAVLIPKLAALHAAGDLPLEKLVDFFAFEHVNDALAALRSGDVAKPVLRFSIGSFGDLDRARVEGAAVDAPGRVTSPETAESTPPALVRS